MVDRPTRPRVLDSGGSTAAARWFRPDEVDRLPVTDVTAEALARSVTAHRQGGVGDV
jgi:hypothetical protein